MSHGRQVISDREIDVNDHEIDTSIHPRTTLGPNTVHTSSHRRTEIVVLGGKCVGRASRAGVNVDGSDGEIWAFEPLVVMQRRGVGLRCTVQAQQESWGE